MRSSVHCSGNVRWWIACASSVEVHSRRRSLIAFIRESHIEDTSATSAQTSSGAIAIPRLGAAWRSGL